MGDFLGDFALSLGDFLIETSGHPDYNGYYSTIITNNIFSYPVAGLEPSNLGWVNGFNIALPPQYTNKYQGLSGCLYAAEQVVTGSNSAICTFKTGHKRLKDISPLKYARAVILDWGKKDIQ